MKYLLSSILVLFASQSFADNMTLSCDIRIYKTYSDGSEPRQYRNDAIVTVTNEGGSKKIQLDAADTSFYIKAPFPDWKRLWPEGIVEDNSSDDKWDISRQSPSGPEYDSARITISRVTGIISIRSERLFAQGGGIRTAVNGTCTRIDPATRKF